MTARSSEPHGQSCSRIEMAFASLEFQDLGLNFGLVLGFLNLSGAEELVQLFV